MKSRQNTIYKYCNMEYLKRLTKNVEDLYTEKSETGLRPK